MWCELALMGVKTTSYHDISFPCGIAQIWVQPVHQYLYLVPVEEDEEDKKQEVHNTETYTGQEKMSEDKKTKQNTGFNHNNEINVNMMWVNTHQTPFAILQGVVW